MACVESSAWLTRHGDADALWFWSLLRPAAVYALPLVSPLHLLSHPHPPSSCPGLTAWPAGEVLLVDISCCQYCEATILSAAAGCSVRRALAAFVVHNPGRAPPGFVSMAC